jgi:hypothetical protein
MPYFEIAQIRTCLWPRVDRWGSDKRPSSRLRKRGFSSLLDVREDVDVIGSRRRNRRTPLSTGDVA